MPRNKHVITPEMEKEIRRVYQEKAGMGNQSNGDSPVRNLALRLGIPRWRVSRYARDEGLIAKTQKCPDWSDEELVILKKKAHRQPVVIQKCLKKRGYVRSVTGIVLKRKRMRCPQNLNGQSARSLAFCFGIDAHAVTRWIDKGYLRAEKRGTLRTSQQGGDTYYIKDEWVKNFIVESVESIDFRKVDKYWLVSILTG